MAKRFAAEIIVGIGQDGMRLRLARVPTELEMFASEAIHGLLVREFVGCDFSVFAECVTKGEIEPLPVTTDDGEFANVSLETLIDMDVGCKMWLTDFPRQLERIAKRFRAAEEYVGRMKAGTALFDL